MACGLCRSTLCERSNVRPLAWCTDQERSRCSVGPSKVNVKAVREVWCDCHVVLLCEDERQRESPTCCARVPSMKYTLWRRRLDSRPWGVIDIPYMVPCCVLGRLVRWSLGFSTDRDSSRDHGRASRERELSAFQSPFPIIHSVPRFSRVTVHVLSSIALARGSAPVTSRTQHTLTVGTVRLRPLKYWFFTLPVPASIIDLIESDAKALLWARYPELHTDEEGTAELGKLASLAVFNCFSKYKKMNELGSWRDTHTGPKSASL